ncbi:MAG: hypothetical protein HQL24_08770 [Candidatus Omnitrophica bacterium]|nr:hypothetical protein [Candidatus Omnitrophota bacterium]
MNLNDRKELELRVKRLDEQINLLTNIKSQCIQKLQALSVPTISKPIQSTTNSIVDKITMFKSYFHGREDVFAKLWMNNRTGKRGYSPVCKHEWVRSLCRKPTIKCSECPNQEFLPLDETAIQQHLDGYQVIGVYPIQDTLPKGGFGNLIALPLQKEAAAQGNSVFIDKNGNPFHDQWAFLAAIKKMSYRDVENFVDEASRNGQVIAVRHSPVEENDEPWLRLPSGKRRYKVSINELPEALDIAV